MDKNKGFFSRLKEGYQRFMEGRYGSDKLNMTILWLGVIHCVLSMLIPFKPVKLVLWGLSYILMILAIFRAFSRKIYKRYQENRKFLRFLERLKDSDHRYFDCPRCRQPVRVPKGKGKISITCPKCKEKFIKKT